MTTRAVRFTSAGNYSWTVPVGVTLIRLFMVGGGGGGGGSRTGSPDVLTGASGGGGGEMCINQPMVVAENDVIAITVGAKGTGGVRGTAGGSPFAQPGTDGGATIVGSFRAAGGKGGNSAVGAGNNAGGDGGGVWGGEQRAGIAEPAGQDGTGGKMSGIWTWNGGASGGGYLLAANNGGVGVGRVGGPAPGMGPTPASTFTSAESSGGPGAASVFGFGGAGGEGGNPPTVYDGQAAPASSYGAGGGGGGTDSVASNHVGEGDGADGAEGFAMIMWTE